MASSSTKIVKGWSLGKSATENDAIQVLKNEIARKKGD